MEGVFVNYVVGIILILVPICSFVRDWWIIKNGTEVEGTVVKAHTMLLFYRYEMVSYVADGEEHEAQMGWRSYLPYEKGEKVRVVYHKKNPKKTVIKSATRNVFYFFGCLWIILGVVQIAVG